MRNKPFGKGTFRIAYFGQIKTSKGVKKVVVKAPIIRKNDEADRKFAEENVETQVTPILEIIVLTYVKLIAKLYAEWFSKAGVPKKIKYVEGKLLHIADKGCIPPWSLVIWFWTRIDFYVEPILDGIWKRFSNNAGVVTSEKAASVHAFPHYTWQKSSKRICFSF